MDKIAVLIPCYNEAQTIDKVVRDFKRELPEATIYVYDNNSKDNTAEIARAAGAVVRYERKQGKGNVVRSMFADIDAECYLMIDGDDTYPAENARALIKEVVENGRDMVVGDRLSSTYFTENKRAFHNAGNSGMRLGVQLLFGGEIKDVLTGYRAFSYRFVKTFPILSKGFEIETEMTIHSIDKNMNVTNVIVDYRDRPAGSESKLNTIKDGIKVIFTLGKLYMFYKPLYFYGIIGTLFLIPGLIWLKGKGLSIGEELIVSGSVNGYALSAVIVALLCYFAGLLLSVIRHKERQDFEYRLYDVCAAERKLKGTDEK